MSKQGGRKVGKGRQTSGPGGCLEALRAGGRQAWAMGLGLTRRAVKSQQTCLHHVLHAIVGCWDLWRKIRQWSL